MDPKGLATPLERRGHGPAPIGEKSAPVGFRRPIDAEPVAAGDRTVHLVFGHEHDGVAEAQRGGLLANVGGDLGRVLADASGVMVGNHGHGQRIEDHADLVGGINLRRTRGKAFDLHGARLGLFLAFGGGLDLGGGDLRVPGKNVDHVVAVDQSDFGGMPLPHDLKLSGIVESPIVLAGRPSRRMHEMKHGFSPSRIRWPDVLKSADLEPDCSDECPQVFIESQVTNGKRGRPQPFLSGLPLVGLAHF